MPPMLFQAIRIAVLFPTAFSALMCISTIPGRAQQLHPQQNTQSGATAKKRCDELANSPGDPSRVGGGVPFDKIQVSDAIPVCRDAARLAPTPHFIYLYGRVLFAAQRNADALQQFKVSASRGYAAAMNGLAYMYLDGEGIPKSNSDAAAWYRKAAEAGSSDGMVNLGRMYFNGQGVPKDDSEAVAWYRKAVEAGSPEGMNSLAIMYQNGQGVPKDDSEAVAWYRKAAEAGNSTGMNNLAIMYQNGEGVPQSDSDAAVWYRKAADAGNPDGIEGLGNMLSNSLQEPERRAAVIAALGLDRQNLSDGDRVLAGVLKVILNLPAANSNSAQNSQQQQENLQQQENFRKQQEKIRKQQADDAQRYYGYTHLLLPR